MSNCRYGTRLVSLFFFLFAFTTFGIYPCRRSYRLPRRLSKSQWPKDLASAALKGYTSFCITMACLWKYLLTTLRKCKLWECSSNQLSETSAYPPTHAATSQLIGQRARTWLVPLQLPSSYQSAKQSSPAPFVLRFLSFIIYAFPE